MLGLCQAWAYIDFVCVLFYLESVVSLCLSIPVTCSYGIFLIIYFLWSPSPNIFPHCFVLPNQSLYLYCSVSNSLLSTFMSYAFYYRYNLDFLRILFPFTMVPSFMTYLWPHSHWLHIRKDHKIRSTCEREHVVFVFLRLGYLT